MSVIHDNTARRYAGKGGLGRQFPFAAPHSLVIKIGLDIIGRITKSFPYNNFFPTHLLFESLLKYLYPNRDNRAPVKTLGQVFQTTLFTADFGTGIQTTADTLQDILDAVTDDSILTAFCTASRLRNTTGHNLVRDNVFHLTSNYETLLDQSMNALLYLIERKFIR